MADDRTARPVSGEIMTGAAGDAHGQPIVRTFDDIIDADYEVVGERREPTGAAGRPAFAPASAPLDGMGMLRRDGAPAAFMAVRGGPIFWVFGIGLAAASFWVSGGHALVRQTALLAPSDKRPLFSISGIVSRVDVSGPKPLLFVDGHAVNGGAKPAELPALEIQVTGNDGRLTRYRLGTSDHPLQPGEQFAFSSRLDVPKNGVKTVSVSFGE